MVNAANGRSARRPHRRRLIISALAGALFLSVFMPFGTNELGRSTANAAPGYHVIFSDNFDRHCPTGSFPQCTHGAWTAYPDGWTDTSGRGTYNCSTVCSEHDGVLDLYLHSQDGKPMVAAPEPILAPGLHDFGSGLTAGRYTIVFKADALPCYKTAWLLWPDSDNWPAGGEIDFPEGRLNETFSGFMHHKGASSGSAQDAYDSHTAYTDWHVATIEWRPDRGYTNFFLNGALIGHSTSDVPDTPMHWVLQTETESSHCPSGYGEAGHVLIAYMQVEVPN